MKLFTEYKWEKAYYFAYSAAGAPILPFTSVIAKGIGFTIVEAGTLLTVSTLLSILTKPAFGSLADKYLLHKAVFMGAIIIDSLLGFMIQFYPPIVYDKIVTYECSSTPRVLIEINYAFIDAKTIAAISDSPLSCQLSLEAQSFDNSEALPVATGSFKSVILHTGHTQATETLVMDVNFPNDSDNSSLSWYCSRPINITGRIHCDNPVMNEIVTQPVKEGSISRSTVFWVFAFFEVVKSMACSIALSIGDSICLKQLGEDTEKIADIRLFGSLTWGTFGLLGGSIADWYSDGKGATYYTLNCYLGAFFHVLTLISVYNMKCEFREKPNNVISNLKSVLFKDAHFIVFLAVSVLSGCCSGLITNYLNWFIEEVAVEGGYDNSIKTLEGIALFIQTIIGEIPFLLISAYLIRWIGHVYCFTVVFIGFGLRFLLYYFLSNPWWIIPIEILNGMSNTTFRVVAATYSFQLALPGTEATVLGLSTAAFDAAGCSLGVFIGGIIIDSWGLRMCFLFTAISVFFAAFLNTFLQYFLAKVFPRKLKNSAQVEETKI